MFGTAEGGSDFPARDSLDRTISETLYRFFLVQRDTTTAVRVGDTEFTENEVSSLTQRCYEKTVQKTLHERQGCMRMSRELRT